MRLLLKLIVVLGICGVPNILWADKAEPIGLQKRVEELQEELRQLKVLVAEQQKKIAALEAARGEAQATKALVASEKPAPQIAPVTQTSGRGRIPYLPDIGVVGDIVGTLSDTLEKDEGNNRFSLRELELILGHDVDPYSRFDVTLASSDTEHVHLEDAYVSYWNLPFEARARIGRMHQYLGKASAIHRDSLETVDEPLVIQKYLGQEGYYKTGLDLSAFTPFSSATFTQELALGLMEGGVGEGGALLADAPNRPSFYTHLKNFWNISDLTSLELGGTYLLGAAEKEGTEKVNAFGVDLTWIRHFSPINKFKLQGEALFQRRPNHERIEAEDHVSRSLRHESHEDHDHESAIIDDKSAGFYFLADYRLAKRWGIGTRYDWVQPIELAEEHYSRSTDQALTGYLTFYQSEFARWRFQYQYARLVGGENDHRFFLQGTFAIGTHKHALQ